MLLSVEAGSSIYGIAAVVVAAATAAGLHVRAAEHLSCHMNMHQPHQPQPQCNRDFFVAAAAAAAAAFYSTAGKAPAAGGSQLLQEPELTLPFSLLLLLLLLLHSTVPQAKLLLAALSCHKNLS
jgi:hypothetical protein